MHAVLHLPSGRCTESSEALQVQEPRPCTYHPLGNPQEFQSLELPFLAVCVCTGEGAHLQTSREVKGKFLPGFMGQPSLEWGELGAFTKPHLGA